MVTVIGWGGRPEFYSFTHGFLFLIKKDGLMFFRFQPFVFQEGYIPNLVEKTCGFEVWNGMFLLLKDPDVKLCIMFGKK